MTFSSTYEARRLVIAAVKLSPIARVAALLILDMQDLDAQACLMGPKALSEVVGCSDRHMRRALGELEDAGVMVRVGRGGRGRRVNPLALRLSPPEAERTPVITTDTGVQDPPPTDTDAGGHGGRGRPDGTRASADVDDPDGRARPPGTPTSTQTDTGVRPTDGHGSPPRTRRSVETDAGVHRREREKREIAAVAAAAAPSGMAAREAAVERARARLSIGWSERYSHRFTVPASAGGQQQALRSLSSWVAELVGPDAQRSDEVCDRLLDALFARQDEFAAKVRRYALSLIVEDPGKYLEEGPEGMKHTGARRPRAASTGRRGGRLPAAEGIGFSTDEIPLERGNRRRANG